MVIDDGASPGGEASTIVDATHSPGRVLRVGALSIDALNIALEASGVELSDES